MLEGKKDLKAMLEKYIEERNELDIVIKHLQRALGEEATAEGSTEHGAKPSSQPTPPGGAFDPVSLVFSGMFFGQTQAQAAKMFLEKCDRRPQKTRVIIDALKAGGAKVEGKNAFANVWGMLKRNEEIFIDVPGAGWGLCEWYDPTVIAKMRKESGKGSAKSEEGNGEESPAEKVTT